MSAGNGRGVALAPVRGLNGRWSCDGCGRVDVWGDGWLWFGAWIKPNVKPMHTAPGPYIERVLCPECAPADAEVLDA